jgi:adenosyl cobinamide kinase/adenosyl cobinamide phosphate guanylyltransferase
MTLLEKIKTNLSTIEEKEKEYKDYIDEHRNNVQKAWNKVKKIDNKWIKNNIDKLDENIKNHDLSKYEPEEFNAYRKKYYPINEDEKANSDAEFEAAWNHHYINNPHHWQYWTCSDGDLDADKMSGERIDNNVMMAYIEMLCDWIAMSMKFGDKPDEWYKSNKENMNLSRNEQKELEKILKEYTSK